MNTLQLNQDQLSELNGLQGKKVASLSEIEIAQLIWWWVQAPLYAVEIRLLDGGSVLNLFGVQLSDEISSLKKEDLDIQVIFHTPIPTQEPNFDSIKQQININLKSERERLNLTQEAFGRVAGVSKRTVVDWEKGITSPTAYQIYKLVQAGMNVRRLFAEVGTSSSAPQNLPSATTKPMRLVYSDINYYDKSGDYVLDGINLINSVFQDHPPFQLVNIETKYDETGDEIGLRYFYYAPV